MRCRQGFNRQGVRPFPSPLHFWRLCLEVVWRNRLIQRTWSPDLQYVLYCTYACTGIRRLTALSIGHRLGGTTEVKRPHQPDDANYRIPHTAELHVAAGGCHRRGKREDAQRKRRHTIRLQSEKEREEGMTRKTGRRKEEKKTAYARVAASPRAHQLAKDGRRCGARQSHFARRRRQEGSSSNLFSSHGYGPHLPTAWRGGDDEVK